MSINLSYTEEIETVLSFFEKENIWHSITLNLRAESCADAAQKRNRLGNTGIPLHDELKSNFGFYFTKSGEKEYVLLHCRGDQKIDLKKVEQYLGAPFQRIEQSELSSVFQLEYGIVNPLIFIKSSRVSQIFDYSVFENTRPPYTMMTNAGHHNWGLEFRPKELYSCVKDSIKLDITQKKEEPTIKVEKIGILTGNSPESGIMLWQRMNDLIRERMSDRFMGDISLPDVFILSNPAMGLSMELELREKETKRAVLSGVEQLCKQGATLVVIACNTTQYFMKEVHRICKKYKAEFVSIPDVVEKYLHHHAIKEFDFLGIQYVTDFEEWSAFKKLNQDFTLHVPDDKELQKINDLAFEVKRKNVSSSGINKLRQLIQNTTQTKHVVIALTEISILLATQKKRQRSEKTYIDTLSILAEELAVRFISNTHY